MAEPLPDLSDLTSAQRALLELRLRRRRGGVGGVLRRRGGGEEAPASFAQRRLWMLEGLSPVSAVYNVAAGVWLRGSLSEAALGGALSEVERRHEVLRSVLRESESGEPVQEVSPWSARALPVVDLSALPSARRRAVAEGLARREGRRPFRLSSGPLWRRTLVRLGEAERLLVMVLHHAVADGGSVEVLLREVAELVGGSALPELPVQYGDWAAWERGAEREEVLSAQEGFWRQRLSGELPVLELPADRSGGAARGVSGGRRWREIPSAQMAPVLDLARRLGATPTMVLLALWGVLLSRWSGQREVMVGMPVDLRRGRETEGLIGFFVNTVVVRLELGDDPPLVRLIERVREAVLSAHEHQELPYERVVEAVGAGGRGGSLFQAAFEVQGAGVVGRRLGEVGLELLEIDTGTAKFEVTLFVREGAAGGPWRATVEWSAARFAAATAELWLSQYAALVSAAGASPEQPVGSLGLWGPGERERVVGEWSGARVPWQPSPAGVDELVWRQAAAEPAAVAVEDGRGVVRYGELTARAAELASRLAGLGVGRGERVGLAVERGAALVVAMLGVVRSGAAYVPLDEASPAERLSWVLSDTGARVVVRGAGWSGAAESLAGRQVVELSADGSPAAPGPAAPVAVRTAGADLAYVIYTSGSTGVPKGVGVTHRNVLDLLVETDYVRLVPGDVVAQIASPAFDAATFEVWGALLAGARLSILGRYDTLEPGELAGRLRERGITVLMITTALFNKVSQEVPGAFAGLGQVLFGGEAVDPGAVRAALAGGPPARLLHVYGPTECTTFSLWHPVLAVPDGAETVPIGGPTAGTRAVAFDRWGGLAPAGAPGELCLGGDGLARGYLGRPDLTAARFVPDPLGERPGARLYRTGDLVRRVDGAFEFLGRTDHQVKIRGFRIEPGEVEAALREQPAVREALVAALPDPAGGRRLVAWWVRQPGHGETDAALRAALRARLPEPMIPAAFVEMAELPLNTSGKVDRARLPRPEGAEPPVEEPGGGTPRTQIEELLAGIYAAVLGRERVGLHDSFLDLGGHSLLATQLVSRVRDACGVDLPLPAVFEEPTVAGLAGRVEALLRAGRQVELPPLERAPRSGPIPLSFAQERLWFLDQIDPGTPAYNVPLAVRLRGRLDARALDAALDALVERHEALRTRFAAGADGRPVQLVDPWARQGRLSRVDLAGLGLPDARWEGLVREVGGAEAARRFDLEAGPLLRAVLLRRGPEEHVLLLTLHHVVADGWSLGVLLGDLGRCYGRCATGEAPDLPPLPVQYADFAVWQRRCLTGELLSNLVAFWREALAGAPPRLDLPTDRPWPAVQTFRGGNRPIVIAEGLVERLEEIGRRAATTSFVVFAGAFEVLLSRWCGTADVAVGTPVSGRTAGETEPLIGFFVNTLVLRRRLDGRRSFAAHLAAARHELIADLQHQDLPFDRLVEELRHDRGSAANPLFRAFFALHGELPERLAPAGTTATLDRLDRGTATFDLSLVLRRVGGRLRGFFEYAEDLFDATTVQRLERRWSSLLAEVAGEPQRPLSLLSALGRAEHHQLLFEWAGAARRFATAGSIADRFAEQAARRPRAIALTDGREVTYEELERRSRRLAERLVELGVGVEVPVGILLERSAEVVVAMLAVLRAGGMYVPMDPTHPRERLAYVLEDAGARLVVTAGAPAEALPDGVRKVAPDEALATAVALREPSVPDPGAAAYAIYTSGSTGRPKGVVVSHRAVLRLMAAADERFDFGPQDVWTFFHSPSFDFSVWEIWGCLLHGGRLVVVPYWVAREPGHLLDLLRRERVTVLNQTPSSFRELVAAEGRAGDRGATALRYVVFGGEALDFAALAPWIERHGDAAPRLVNMYGITETTVHTTFREVSGRELGLVPSRIGAPLADLRLHLLGRDHRPVPIGSTGEIHVGGDGLARGYLGQPRRTAERFVPDPFAAERGSRLYCSGDLARHLADGDVAYLGRADHQVKIRGFRIELGEIEAQAAAHPALTAAVVLARSQGPGEQRLVAYLVPRNETDAADPDALRSTVRAFLAERVPDYMVPSAFVILGELPLTSSGKVDRRVLPAPDREATGLDDRFVAPRNPVEQALAAVWSECLGVDRVGVHDDFFELGGHSLVLTRVAARIRDVFHAELPLRSLFDASTLEQVVRVLARHLIESSRPAAAGSALSEVRDLAPAEVRARLLAAAEALSLGGSPP
jgi:amino acid adenylation domain-containing protein